ncbi:hypothetical protein OUZ56_007833 [Daphnia magna]|uniref:Uncharacterized protein n=1 Tax=Daphnia magna TaxID=35525 RepID=A0ABR0AB51_9CRUS|nr:hypothetical protein OUZ56_007833 [Daphnia magna]
MRKDRDLIDSYVYATFNSVYNGIQKKKIRFERVRRFCMPKCRRQRQVSVRRASSGVEMDPGITLARASLTSVTRVVTYASLPSVNRRVTSVRVRGTNISLNTV